MSLLGPAVFEPTNTFTHNSEDGLRPPPSPSPQRESKDLAAEFRSAVAVSGRSSWRHRGAAVTLREGRGCVTAHYRQTIGVMRSVRTNAHTHVRTIDELKIESQSGTLPH